MNFPYEDIVNLPHPISPRRARMSDADRAAQFSPFAALTGHDAAIAETARLTEARPELAEDEKARLNQKLQKLEACLSRRPVVSITCFFPDARKEGGSCVTVTGVVKKIDTVQQVILMESGERLALEDVLALLMPV